MVRLSYVYSSQPITPHLVVTKVRHVTGENSLLPYHHRLVSDRLGEVWDIIKIDGGGDGGGGCGGGLCRQTCAKL